MKNKGWLILLLFFIWCLVSWYWYVCGIKGFCNQQPEPVTVVETPTPEPEPIPEPEPTPEPEPEPEVEPEPVAVVETAPEPEICEDYLTDSIKLGENNKASEVRKLETFLNEFENTNLPVNGVYEAADERAVRSFQAKYASDVLTPWGLRAPTGFVFTTTRAKINELYCQ